MEVYELGNVKHAFTRSKNKIIKPHGHYTSVNYNFLLEGFKLTSEGLMMNHASAKRRLNETEDQEENAVVIDQENNEAKVANEQVDAPPAMKIEEFILNYWVDDNNNSLYRPIGPVIDGSRANSQSIAITCT